MNNNTIRGTSIPDSTILTNLREAIERGEILVKVSKTTGNYKITELIDKETGYKLIPEHVVPVVSPFLANCEACNKNIARIGDAYTTIQPKGSDKVFYYHRKCHLLRGTTSSDNNWNGEI